MTSRFNLITGLSVFALFAAGAALPALAQGQDARKDAAEATKQANAALLRQLPFQDTTDFQNAKKGFIAALPAK
ncbi:hypothetical protein [Bosea sp. TAF32]|uniref:hypothetical protein n=1 Tax=Bosea sp. TAF32 TaxID=3237482 RepID=UPI003F8DCB93